MSQIALPELATLRRTLLGWLGSADAAGLDEDGIVALFTDAHVGRPFDTRGLALATWGCAHYPLALVTSNPNFSNDPFSTNDPGY